MKVLASITAIVLFSCASPHPEKKKELNHEKPTAPFSVTVDCKMPAIDSLIVREDTTYVMEGYSGHTMKSYDDKGRLIKILKANLFESNSERLYAFTTIYDSVGHIIYEDKVRGFDNKWYCCCYRYNKYGQMAKKEGYIIDMAGNKNGFAYEGDRLVKTTIDSIITKRKRS